MFKSVPPENELRGDTRHQQIVEHTCAPLSIQELGDIALTDEINKLARFSHRTKMDSAWTRTLFDNLKMWYPGWRPTLSVSKVTRKSNLFFITFFYVMFYSQRYFEKCVGEKERKILHH